MSWCGRTTREGNPVRGWGDRNWNKRVRNRGKEINEWWERYRKREG